MKNAKFNEDEWRALDVHARVQYACWRDNSFLEILDPGEVTNANDRALLLKFMPTAADAIDVNGFSDDVVTAIVAVQPTLLVRVDPARIPSLDWAYLNRVRPDIVTVLERRCARAGAMKAAAVTLLAAFTTTLLAALGRALG